MKYPVYITLHKQITCKCSAVGSLRPTRDDQVIHLFVVSISYGSFLSVGCKHQRINGLDYKSVDSGKNGLMSEKSNRRTGQIYVICIINREVLDSMPCIYYST